MNQIINHKDKYYLKTETGYREIVASTDSSLTIELSYNPISDGSSEDDLTIPLPHMMIFTLEMNYKQKVNSKNEITIRKIKDSYSREEVFKLIEKHTEDMLKQRITLDKWISENI